MAEIKIENIIQVNLKAMRLGCDLTLREVARRTKIDASNFSKMERGLLIIEEQTWKKILRVLKCKKIKL